MASLMLASVLAVAALAFAQAKEVVPLDHWYAFDGTHSDFTQQFYRRFEAGESLPPLQIDGVPKEIQEFLGSHGVSFDGLPGLLQRAVIWDFGYALDNDLNLGKIYTRCGRSMAQIAVPMKAYERTGCTVQNCTAPDGRPHHRSFRCNGLQMATVSMCASEAVTRPGHTSMWADGGDDEFIPEVRVVRHDWTELGKSYLMFALHVEPDDSEKAWSICPSAPSMIIPCRPLAMVKTKKAWCRPVRGKVLGPWIRNYANDHRRVTVIELTLIVGAVMIVAVPLARFLQKRRKKRSAQESMEDHQAIVGSNGLRSSFNSLRSSTDMTLARPSSALENSDAYNYLEAVAQQDEPLGTATWSFKSGKELGQRASVSSGRQRAALRTLQAFESHPLINHKRISLRKIQVVRQLSTSATSEVWLALYNMHQVAIKHLVPERRCSVTEMQLFAAEVFVLAKIKHPNIVSFVGVAWSTLQHVVMVVEYMARGDLASYLAVRKPQAGSTNGQAKSAATTVHNRAFTWDNQKLHIAQSVASALVYLHGLSPKLIHRELKSRNVLLSAHMEVKLCDFGISRRKYNMEEADTNLTMTGAVGAVSWTAPELLIGESYNEKIDIYSYGVLLSEVDTCVLPYQDEDSLREGLSLHPLCLLRMIVHEGRRPAFQSSCPPQIQRLARRCLEKDPDKRPQAQSIVEELSRFHYEHC